MSPPMMPEAGMAARLADAERVPRPGRMQGAEQAGRPAQPRLVMHVFPSFAVGGAQVRYAALANRFRARWRHVVVPLDGNGACAARIGPQVPFTLLDPPRARGTAGRIWQIQSLLRRLRPDVLVTGNWGSMDWAIAQHAIPGLRHLHIEDGFGPEEAAQQFRRRVLARRWALRRSTVVLPSVTLLRLAQEEWRLPRGRLRYVPNGLDLNRFRPDGPVASPAPGPAEVPLIGTVAALRPEKALDRLLRACALLARRRTPFRLAILGDGPDRARLQALAAELGIEGLVTFAGHVPDPAAAYRSFDVFALSSDTEQMPFSVLEAMGTGLAVASTDVGDVSAMLAAPNLPFVTPKDDADFAIALATLLEEPERRRSIGAANRSRAVLDFSEEAMFQSYAALIEG
ncbi:glycosyltransferase family 4 protein [Falsiroseomonas tokyonensis]|uniref:Glycosyltransferase family 4 protein n=1 Tax=Falsiroseomonas tokyonensis TaxID=430521 RepID=A0ABV7BRR8_9PROT|nr:glycosyltransferase family 4 protein [Falsiroseomonas tokyonensis]MBU8536743.1 glycosyltransferase family 4 protein [Falsiroseomonas tokyonensis]